MKPSFLLAEEQNYDEMRPEQIALFEGEGEYLVEKLMKYYD